MLFTTHSSFWLRCITALLLLLGPVAKAQFLVQYPSPAQAPTVCQGDAPLTVQVYVAATGSSNTVTLNLPPGITYVAGSVTKTGGTAALGIAEAGGTASAPQFALSPGTLSPGQNITFTVRRRADCPARAHALAGGTFKDTVTVSGSNGSTVEDGTGNSYAPVFPSLSLGQPAAITDAVPGTDYTRTFTVTNGAAGCAGAVHFYIVYPGGGISLNSLSLGGTNLSPVATNGDTLFFSVSGVGPLTGDGLLCNGESLTFTENFRVNTCDAATLYGAGWGCSAAPAAWCQTVSGSGSVSMVVGVSSFTGFSTSLAPGYVDMCGTGNGGYINMQSTYSWGGSGDTLATTAYDVKLGMGGYPPGLSLGYISTDVYSDFIDFAVSGSPVPASRILYSGIVTVDLADLFTTDPDGVGGLSDTDGDGYFDDLQPGTSINITFKLSVNCAMGCGGNSDYGISGDIRYRNLCGTSHATQSILSIFGFEVWYTPNGYMPANIQNGTGFTTRLSTGVYLDNYTYLDNANTRHQCWMTLPPGISVVGNATWTFGQYPAGGTPVAVPYTISNDTLYITGPSPGFGYAHVDLMYDCATGNATSLSFAYGLNKLNNIATGCRCRSPKSCGAFSATVICPTPCAAGPKNGLPVVRRTDNSLGWTDASMTARQTAANIGAYDLSRALVYDTIEVRGFAIQSGSANNLFLRQELPQAGGGQNKLTPLTVSYRIYRGGTQLTAGATNSFSQTATGGNIQRIDWDLIAALPPGGLLDGDSIVTESRYAVNLVNLPEHDEQSGGAWYHYNLPATTPVYCNSPTAEMYLVGTSPINGNNASYAYGCTPSALGWGTNFIARRFDPSGTSFLNEFRPGMRIDSIVVEVPASYTFNNISVNGYVSIPSLVPNLVSGNTYHFANDGSWPLVPITVTNAYGVICPVTVTASCGTMAYEAITYRVYIKDFYYAFATSPSYPVAHQGNLLGKTENIIFTNGANLVMENLSGTVQAAAPEESFVFRISSTGASEAPYGWVAVPQQSGITVTGLTDEVSGTPIPTISYSGGIWFKLFDSPGLASGGYKDYRLHFTYSSCTPDSFKLYGGWNCSSYPTDPDAYTCSKDSLYLKFIPAASEVELNAGSFPAGTVDLCTPAQYNYIVNSSQAGNTINNRFRLEVPTGMTPVPGSFEAEYPLGTGNWTAITPSNIGNAYTVDLAAHPAYPANGLPGTQNASTSNERQMGVRFRVNTDCDFVANSNFLVSTSATSPCGSLPLGNALPVQGPPVAITGVNAPYLTVHILEDDTLANCQNTRINLAATVVGGTTGNTGTLEIELPENVGYVAGSLQCQPGPCPTFLSESVVNGKVRLLLAIPSGMVSGSMMRYSIEVHSPVNMACGPNTLTVRSLERTGPIACASAPGGVCPVLMLSTGNGSMNLQVDKPILQITSATGGMTVHNNPANGYANHLTLSVTINNTGTVNQVPANPINLSFYCGLPGGTVPVGPPLAVVQLTGSIPAGGNLTETVELNLDCNTGNGLVVQVSDAYNCVCTPTFLYFDPNEIPVAADDYANSNEDVPVAVNVLGNDVDTDGNLVPGTVTVLSGPSNGTVTVNPSTGAVTYTPNPNFNGSDTFTYQVCDDGTPLPAQCDTAQVHITVNAINDPMLANPDQASTPEDTPVSFGVTGNDSDIDGSVVTGTLTVAIPPTNGSVSLNLVTGTVTYTPDPNFNGTDTFVYQICDNGTPYPVSCDTALVTINVVPVNDPPTAHDDNVVTASGTSVTIDVTANDTDIDGTINDGSVTIVTGPVNGGSVTVDAGTGSIIYVPGAGTCTTDSFSYLVCDTGTPLPTLCDTATVTIIITDTQAPVIAGCPANVNVNNVPNGCGAPATWTPPTATDNCTNTINWSASHQPGTVFPVGTTPVTYTIGDMAGNQSTCSFTVTVNDTQAPTFTGCPANATLTAGNACTATLQWVPPIPIDNCPGIVSLTGSHTPGSAFALGTGTVTYTATDPAGNQSTCSFTVTVTDATAPVITGCPSDITASSNATDCLATVNWTAPTAGDNCQLGAFTSSHVPGSAFAVGVHTVTYTAIDATGNQSACSFTVTVTDDTAPVIAGCPSDITVAGDLGTCGAVVNWPAPTATDNCQLDSFTGSHIPGTLFAPGTYTVLYTATDTAGNQSTCSFTVTVEDTLAPVVTGCPQNINSCQEYITWMPPVFTDDCTADLNIQTNRSPGSNFPVGNTTVIYTATDEAGNSSTCSFTVRRSAISLLPIQTNISCNGFADGAATVAVKEGIAPYAFDWGAYGTDSLLPGLTAGSYAVTVTDGIACMASDTVTVSQPEPLLATNAGIKSETCGYSDGKAMTLVEGGTEPYDFFWSNGQNNQNLVGVPEGSYILTVTDAHGCADTLKVQIDCVFEDRIPQLVTPNGDGHNDRWEIPGIDGYPNAVVELYNRWGNQVFRASPYANDWEGYSINVTDLGSGRLPAGTYFYMVVLGEGLKPLSGYVELQY